ncbi:MAG TPA: hypothetical protein VHN82_06620 [Methanoregula sp.]|nr:hypothetical protein [Methanoregula sp.]
MDNSRVYSLPALPYGYSALAKFVDTFWSILNWNVFEQGFDRRRG